MITMLAALAGAVILAGGLYYLRGAGTDQESRKIYGVTALAGGVLLAGAVIKIVVLGL